MVNRLGGFGWEGWRRAAEGLQAEKMGAARVPQLAPHNLVAPLPGLCCAPIMRDQPIIDNGTKV